MAMRPGPRPPAGSAAWIAEERSTALQVVASEVDEFSFSARNEVEWLNEHMAEIFSENQINVREIFKTPGKLRGKTPRTVRKAPLEARAPLSDIFSATPKGAPSPFARSPQKPAHTPRLKIAEDKSASSAKPRTSPAKVPHAERIPLNDSGYHGSQDVMDFDKTVEDGGATQLAKPELLSHHEEPAGTVPAQREAEPTSPTQQSEEGSFQSAKEEQTKTAKIISPPSPAEQSQVAEDPAPSPSPIRHTQPPSVRKSPAKLSPQKSSPVKQAPYPQQPTEAPDSTMDIDNAVDLQPDESRSTSDGSSPIRPIVRKSSLNFASLPARQPLTSNKSLGARLSRTSHLEQTRMSYYNRATGGKSLGNTHHEDSEEENDEMDLDDEAPAQTGGRMEKAISAHNKTYTQRLQDQISMLGKSNANGPRPSKSIPHLGIAQQNSHGGTTQQPQPTQPPAPADPSASPKKPPTAVTPGAFPEDDEDDWIAPPTTVSKPPIAADVRPPMAKSYSADVMEEVIGKDTISGADFVLPKQRQQGSRPQSPQRPPAVPERTTSVPKHGKSASVPSFSHFEPEMGGHENASPLKGISVSNPALASVPENERPGTPGSPKSPSRSMRESPLKHVKNKLSSILKSSKGLLASSAALSAEGKSSLLSPSKLHLHAGLSTESLDQGSRYAEPLYPDLTQHATATHPVAENPSPARPRRTRASAEREKREQKQKDKEAKEAQRLAEQMDKLEKAREKEREKARVFSKEQEKIAAMEKQLAAQREQEKPLPAPPKETPKPTRTSPRKAKAQAEGEGRAVAAAPESQPVDHDIEMADAPTSMPPPSAPRSAAGPAGSKGREVRRPIKPVREPASKAKQLPTVIRVNTSSQQPQFHPSNSVLAATLHDTLGGPQHQLKSKASQQSLHAKPSLQSLKSSVSSSGRPKALELAAKRKEQEERDAQRRRDAKAEMERKRAAIQEEERRQEQQRRLEAEKQREKEREQAVLQAEAKKNAQRQAAIEKAKQTRAPPPAVRQQPNGPPEYNTAQEKGPSAPYSRNDQGPPRPPSRMNSALPRPQEEPGRPVNAVLSNAAKSTSKRPLQQDGNEEGSSRPAVARSGPSYQKEVKRMRMTDELDQDMGEAETQPSQSNIKGPPVRPSGGFKKDMPTKSLFAGGYTNATQGATRDLFKATVTSQHNTQVKVAHPLDMAQVSKAAIPFAPNPNAAGPSSHKTPARPAGMAGAKSAAKSAARSSPRFANGDAIELPEIQTDDEDDDDDNRHMAAAAWADSPDLRRALSRQETMDPQQIFGPPAPLNMEEVFSKSKDRWHKFRARTSSANWSGADRLTEEDIRKDLAAREKMRREGGWSYELSKEMI